MPLWAIRSLFLIPWILLQTNHGGCRRPAIDVTDSKRGARARLLQMIVEDAADSGCYAQLYGLLERLDEDPKSLASI